MRLPFVSRERYDEKCAELAALREKYDALLAERATPQPKAREPRPPKAPHDPMLDRLTADLSATITDPAKARAEAERIRREAFGGGL